MAVFTNLLKVIPNVSILNGLDSQGCQVVTGHLFVTAARYQRPCQLARTSNHKYVARQGLFLCPPPRSCYCLYYFFFTGELSIKIKDTTVRPENYLMICKCFKYTAYISSTNYFIYITKCLLFKKI